MRILSFLGVGAALFAAQLTVLPQALWAQQAAIAYVPTKGVTLSGSLSVENGKASIGNNGTITAGNSTVTLKLARGGELRVCASTEVHLSRDNSVPVADSALMIALDRGALEASYVPGRYSDVLLTPDLRILISPPGKADLKIRVNQQGDTCIDNHGKDAPFVTVTSQFEGGVYRVQANQRVMFEHGSLQRVVDNESEPCGCPAATAAPVAVASNAKGSAAAANPFPLAQSEGLAAPPLEPTEPVVPVGVAHAEVQAPIAYDATATPNPAAPEAAGPEPGACRPGAVCDYPTIKTGPAPLDTRSKSTDEQVSSAGDRGSSHHGFFHSIGHFFAKMFRG